MNREADSRNRWSSMARQHYKRRQVTHVGTACLLCISRTSRGDAAFWRQHGGGPVHPCKCNILLRTFCTSTVPCDRACKSPCSSCMPGRTAPRGRHNHNN
ncbi:hypothetical protein PoB_004987100 [Plakobranchus ocellatus]|uniref:Uncharacterized protein n=1 Tax=Plakobranchus ocellatus TaxID=259542 RepID=A0AAV4BJ33_9GAST|nr:hypothetical protein PoB_004987100 [Plakobranchus ocellatus]